MDKTTYPGSGTDVNENYENCDSISMASNEIDFVDRWVNMTVENEVLRGSQLRQDKLRSYPLQDDYEVNINLVRTPVQDGNIDMCYNNRKRSPRISRGRKDSCRSKSPRLRIHSSSQSPQKTYSRTTTPCFKSKGALKCPMRIAELAVPTKRRCMETWRTKCDVLPPFMVERLRQQVMDEKPVVQIKEAISCFKRRKPRSIKSPRMCKQPPRDMKLMNSAKMVDVRNFCVVFSKKMAQRLLTPQNIKLNPQLESVSNIVSDEISKIIQNRHKCRIGVVSNNKIQADISAKIAVWIALILQDATYKILEDDIRVNKKLECKNVTKIEQALRHRKTSELEEEEGPVLDFIDDVIDNVVAICEPQEIGVGASDKSPETMSRGDEIRSIASLDSIENNEFDSSTLQTNITSETGDGTITKNNETELSDTLISPGSQDIDNQSLDQISDINDHIQKQLHKIVDSVVAIDSSNLSIDINIYNETKDNLGNDSPIENVNYMNIYSETKGNLGNDSPIENVNNMNIYSETKGNLGNDSPIENVNNMNIYSETKGNLGNDLSTENVNNMNIHSETKGNLGNDSPIENVDLLLIQESPGISELAHLKQDVGVLLEVEDMVLSPKNISDDENDDSAEFAVHEDVILSPKNISDDEKDNSAEVAVVEDVLLSPKTISDDDKDNSAEVAVVEDVILSPKNISHDEKDDTAPDLENVIPENGNVREEYEAVDEESLDDKNKKVKFSDIGMDVGGQARQVDSNRAFQPKGENERERVSWPSSTDLRDMVFAPPNEHLLSDADEIWPDDLATPPIKPSASVNRSITSLGKILERDEKLLLPAGKIRSTLNWEDPDTTELEILNNADDSKNTKGENIENKQNTNELDAQIADKEKDESIANPTLENNFEDIISIATDETESSLTLNTIKMVKEKQTTDKTVADTVMPKPEIKRLIIDSSTSPINMTVNDYTAKLNQPMKKEKEMDVKNLESDTNVILEAVQQKMKSSYSIPEPKHDYKVYAKSVPSWLRHDHGKGEPSEDSFRFCRPKGKTKDTEIRNWCKDLDRVLVNLEMWNEWIDITCKNVMHLKRRSEINKLYSTNTKRKDARDWFILKKNIDKDSVLWTKLNQKAYERLKIYKEKTKELNQQTEATKIFNRNVNGDKETLLKSLQEIDRICLWMHRMIVSTEYCVVCDCKNNTKRKD